MSTDMYVHKYIYIHTYTNTRFRFNGYDMFIYNHPSNLDTHIICMKVLAPPINNPALLNPRQ